MDQLLRRGVVIVLAVQRKQAVALLLAHAGNELLQNALFLEQAHTRHNHALCWRGGGYSTADDKAVPLPIANRTALAAPIPLSLLTPLPRLTLVPESIQGAVSGFFLISSGSPVSADSSVATSLPEIFGTEAGERRLQMEGEHRRQASTNQYAIALQNVAVLDLQNVTDHNVKLGNLALLAIADHLGNALLVLVEGCQAVRGLPRATRQRPANLLLLQVLKLLFLLHVVEGRHEHDNHDRNHDGRALNPARALVLLHCQAENQGNDTAEGDG